jgi:hypothetical protein
VKTKERTIDEYGQVAPYTCVEWMDQGEVGFEALVLDQAWIVQEVLTWLAQVGPLGQSCHLQSAAEWMIPADLSELQGLCSCLSIL